MNASAVPMIFRERAPAWAAAAAGAFFLTISSLSWFTLERVKYTLRATGAPRSLDAVLRLVLPLDGVLLGLAAGAAMTAIWLEWRHRALTQAINGAAPRTLMFTVVCALVWFGHSILAPGPIVTGDSGTHIARVNHLALSLGDGGSLYWDNYFFGGSTLLQFTGPLFHWMAAIVQLATLDPVWAVKLTAFIARMAAALFMYKLFRRLQVTRPVAIAATLFYAGSYFFTYMEVIRSSYPQLVNFAAMPAIFYCVEGVLIAPAAIGGASAGLALAAMVFVGSHQPTAAIFALFVAAYILVRLWSEGWPAAPMRGFVVAGILAGLGSAFFLVPFALERAGTADNFSATSLIALAQPSAQTLGNMIIWGRTGLGPEYSTYFGLPMLFCVGAGLWAVLSSKAARRQKAAHLYLLVLSLAVLTLFVRGAYVRHATFTFFFLCAASGLGLQLLAHKMPRVVWLPAGALLLFSIDASPAAIQPWTREDLRFMESAGKALAIAAADRRIVEIVTIDGRLTASTDPNLTPLTAARVQILSGPHKQDASPAHNAFAAMLKFAEADVRERRRLSPETRSILAAVNVGWIVGTGSAAMGLPEEIGETVPDPVFGRHIRLQDATPILASGRLEFMERPAAFGGPPFWNFSSDEKVSPAMDAMRAVAKVTRVMEIDPAQRRAGRFLVPELPSGPEWRTGDGTIPRLTLRSYEVGPGIVRIAVDSDRPGFARLAHPFTPALHVVRNGTPIIAVPDVESLAVLPIVRGANDIVLAWIPSLLRQTSFWLTIGMISFLIIFIFLIPIWSTRVIGAPNNSRSK